MNQIDERFAWQLLSQEHAEDATRRGNDLNCFSIGYVNSLLNLMGISGLSPIQQMQGMPGTIKIAESIRKAITRIKPRR